MKIKALLLLSTLLITGQATASTLYSPMVATNTALSDAVQCQLSNISTKNIASVSKPIIMRLISETGVVLEEDAFTSLAAGATIWGTSRTGTLFTRCTFTGASKTTVRAGVVLFAADNEMTMYLKAE